MGSARATHCGGQAVVGIGAALGGDGGHGALGYNTVRPPNAQQQMAMGAALRWCRELWSRSMTAYFGSHCRRSDYASHGVGHTGRPLNAQQQMVTSAALRWCRELWSRSMTTYSGSHCR
eukprot:4668971-Prymnesium_polylepis.1